MHPSRMAALGGPPAFDGMASPVPVAVGQVRPFDAIDSPGEDGQAKRPRIEKLPGGQFYPVCYCTVMRNGSLCIVYS